VRDGDIVAAAQEERFTRKKHDAGFPQHAIDYCLREGRITPEQLDYVVFYDKPFRKFDRLFETYLGYAAFGLRSLLLEATGDYFEIDYPDPFMVKVYKIKPDKRAIIPAVTHVDGTGRLQTVAREENPLYWCLIKEFEKLTGVPVVLNTSFNENEPIVCTPQEALDCFLRTEMDVLVLGRQVVRRLC